MYLMRFDFSFQEKKKRPNGGNNCQKGSLSFYSIPTFLKASLRQMDAIKSHRKCVANVTAALMRKVCCFIWLLFCIHDSPLSVPRKKKDG